MEQEARNRARDFPRRLALKRIIKEREIDNPPDHTHPTLSRPLALSEFLAEFQAIWLRALSFLPARPTPTVELSDDLDRTHCRNSRRYAEVVPGRRAFFFAPQVLWLPRANRLGLIAHEIGHVLAFEELGMDHDERVADEAALEIGVEIRYDRRWPGKGLQSGRFLTRGSAPK